MNFASGLERHGNQTALILRDGERISYKDLAHHADAIYALDGAPSTKRSLVAIECNNQLSSVAGYLGALRNDFPALLVDASLAPELRDRLYDHFGVTSILNSEGSWRLHHKEIPEIHPAVALLLSTSGSTGTAKLVKLTLDNLQANATAIASYLLLSGEERPITTLPMHYSYGLSVLNSHLSCGATVLLNSDAVTARSFWDFFRDHEATSFAGVPTTYAMLRQLRFGQMTLPSLRYMTQAGGQLSADMVRWYVELAASRHQRFYVMYGQTEATARMSYVPSERIIEKVGSVGVAIPNGQIELVADDGNLIAGSDVVGELRYSGPNVMMGYAENITDLALGDVQGATLMTGDLARRDDDGYLYITGRIKRFIKIFGNRIGLDEVESQLRNKGFDVAVTGYDDLLMVALRGNKAEADRLTGTISASYRLHHSAVRVVPVSEFPVSSSGKIQYGVLLKELSPQSGLHHV